MPTQVVDGCPLTRSRSLMLLGSSPMNSMDSTHSKSSREEYLHTGETTKHIHEQKGFQWRSDLDSSR